MPFLEQLAAIVGAEYVLGSEAIPERYLGDWMLAMSDGTPLALVRPRTTADVSACLALCHREGVAVVPQGGLTGVVGGATPVDRCVVLSLERMTGIEGVVRPVRR